MKTIYYSILAILLLAVSCAKENIGDEPLGTQLITLSFPEDTRIAIGERTAEVYPVTWQAGDRILVNNTVESEALGSEYDGQKNAQFSLPEKAEYPLTVIAPSELCSIGYIMYPVNQTYDPSRMCNGNAIFAGYSTKSSQPVQMQAMCGVVRIPVKGTAAIRKISVRSIGNEVIAGRYEFDRSTMLLRSVADTGDQVYNSSLTNINCEVTLSSTATVFYVAIPAGVSYSKGLKVTISDADGACMSRTMFSSGKTFTGGIVTEMPEIEYVPGAPTEEVFEVSETEVEFGGRLGEPVTLTVVTFDEDVSVAVENAEWLSTDIPSVIPAERTVSLALQPSTANVCDQRAGTIRFIGAKSGKEKNVTISQKNLYTAANGFPSRWIINKSETYYTNGKINEAGLMWENEGIATCTEGAGVGCTYMSGGSITSHKPTYTLNVSSSAKIASLCNLTEGDYLQFSVPVVDLPAGTDFDFMITLEANSAAAPKYWLFEYWDGGEWKHDESKLYTAEEDSSIKYSFYIKYFSSANHRTYIASFRKNDAVHNDFVKMRARVVGKINGAGTALKPTPSAIVYLAPRTYDACHLVCYKDAPAIKDTIRLSQYGNSFTYYNGSAFKIKEIARSQGHQIDYHVNVKGSQEFENHLYDLEFSQKVMREGNYDYSIIQDGSYFHAQYHAGDEAIQGVTIKYTSEQILQYNLEMTAEIKKYSPNAKIILENPWSYSRKAAGDNYLGFGSFQNFADNQWAGCLEIAAADSRVNWVSPVGRAFQLARNNYGFTQAYNYLQHTDNYHPNLYGSYLKAAVYYLIIYGESFTTSASDCNIPASDASTLRQIAEEIVMADRESFHIH